nr:hypothetical protein [Tanacetum cinerariifolium]
ELPSLFLESCFNGNMHVSVTSNRRYGFKAKLVVPNKGPIRIMGDRWVQFCLTNMQKAILLHFMEQGDDTFYVTRYDNDGLECGGYNVVRKLPRRIVTRVWPYQDYPQHQLNEDDWNALVEAVRLEWGMLVFFIKTDLNTLGLMDFNTCGNKATITKFDGVTNLKKRQHDMTLDEKADDRMEHICLWPGHTKHFGKRNDTFYKRFSSTLDKQRLNKYRVDGGESM